MNRFETNLRIPGPTSLPSAVREAGARQMINHRGPEFAGMLERVTSGLKTFFGTANDIVLITSAGSGGLEAAIVNTLSPGDKVLAVSAVTLSLGHGADAAVFHRLSIALGLDRDDLALAITGHLHFVGREVADA